PRCRAAVTLGGGMTIEKGFPGADGSAWNNFSSFHTRRASSSMLAGSYVFESWVLMRNPGFQISNLNFRYYGSGVTATTSRRPYRTTTGMARAGIITLILFIGSNAKATCEPNDQGPMTNKCPKTQ